MKISISVVDPNINQDFDLDNFSFYNVSVKERNDFLCGENIVECLNLLFSRGERFIRLSSQKESRVRVFK